MCVFWSGFLGIVSHLDFDVPAPADVDAFARGRRFEGRAVVSVGLLFVVRGFTLRHEPFFRPSVCVLCCAWSLLVVYPVPLCLYWLGVWGSPFFLFRCVWSSTGQEGRARISSN